MPSRRGAGAWTSPVGTFLLRGMAMKKIVAVAVLAAMTTLCTVAAVATVAAGTGGHPRTGPNAARPPEAPAPPEGGVLPEGGVEQQEVSRAQYDILVRQCRYANTPGDRERCRTEVREQYRIGRRNPTLDCRTYSGVTVCGRLELSAQERSCVKEAVGGGMTRRRAEVECYAFR